VRIAYKNGRRFTVYKCYELIAILIAFSCILLIKDEQVLAVSEHRYADDKLEIRVCLSATSIGAACSNLYEVSVQGFNFGVIFY